MLLYYLVWLLDWTARGSLPQLAPFSHTATSASDRWHHKLISIRHTVTPVMHCVFPSSLVPDLAWKWSVHICKTRSSNTIYKEAKFYLIFQAWSLLCMSVEVSKWYWPPTYTTTVRKDGWISMGCKQSWVMQMRNSVTFCVSPWRLLLSLMPACVPQWKHHKSIDQPGSRPNVPHYYSVGCC